jgi:hypothetical protein
LFAKFREALSLWLRRRGVPFAAVWTREKLSGGQAEVEHAHLLFHLRNAWLKEAKLISVTGGPLEIALSKSLPNLQAVEVTSDALQPFALIPGESPSVEAWSDQFKPKTEH